VEDEAPQKGVKSAEPLLPLDVFAEDEQTQDTDEGGVAVKGVEPMLPGSW
jgi:hypothetical protein